MKRVFFIILGLGAVTAFMAHWQSALDEIVYLWEDWFEEETTILPDGPPVAGFAEEKIYAISPISLSTGEIVYLAGVGEKKESSTYDFRFSLLFGVNEYNNEAWSNCYSNSQSNFILVDGDDETLIFSGTVNALGARPVTVPGAEGMLIRAIPADTDENGYLNCGDKVQLYYYDFEEKALHDLMSVLNPYVDNIRRLNESLYIIESDSIYYSPKQEGRIIDVAQKRVYPAVAEDVIRRANARLNTETE